MRDIWFLITDHKGIVKILAILIAIFCVVSIGVSSYTSTMKVQEQQEQQAKKKEKEKQIKNSSVKLKKDQQKTIDEYDDATAQFSALLSSNVWATYSGTGRTLYFTDSSIIIADPEADPSKVEKPFVIKGLSTEKVDVGEMKNLTRYNCAYESDDDKTRVLTVDKNDDGTYFKMSIDVKNSGTNEEYVRTQAAGTSTPTTTKTIHHPAETIRIAICDTCGADITDDIEGHKKSTGHPWYHYDAKVVKEAWDETVTVN